MAGKSSPRTAQAQNLVFAPAGMIEQKGMLYLLQGLVLCLSGCPVAGQFLAFSNPTAVIVLVKYELSHIEI